MQFPTFSLAMWAGSFIAIFLFVDQLADITRHQLEPPAQTSISRKH